ncbi:MAG: hypothetical protein ABIE68_03510 [bacterium]
MKDENIKEVKSLTWDEVFEFWRGNEADSPAWEKHYKSRGFNSWEEWRETYAKRFKCRDKKWGLYKVVEPLKSVPEFFGGPFSGWTKLYYNGAKERTFSELAENKEIQANGIVNRLIKDFPEETIITAMRVKNEKIVVIEGMHRCLALAMMAKNNKHHSGKVLLALGESDEELPSSK